VPPFDVEVLLPVHNEGESIEATMRGMYSELSKVARTGFIVCEDGSKDNSKEVLRHVAEELPIRLNLSDDRKGYSKAMREGMDMLEADYLLCLDSDGQCDPKDFAGFWKVRESADVVIGWRTERADPLVRRIFSRFFFLIYQAVFRVPVHDPSCPYVLMSKPVAKRMAQELGSMKEGFWWEFVARTTRLGFTIRELPIHHQLRSAGVTQVYKWQRMPEIFFRHVAAIATIWKETRENHRVVSAKSPARQIPLPRS
jgi:glycosyltransferase involved in cell wall biosynthesis